MVTTIDDASNVGGTNFIKHLFVELAQRVSGRKNRKDLYTESIIPGAASERAEEP